jgi:drug/metabolite transporter (DMT)-like permease
MRHMLGIIIALFTSLAWAGSSTILKYLSSRINAISINAMRLWVGSIVLIAVIFFSGRSTELGQAHLFPILMIALAGILSIAAGDTVYIKSLSYLDVSRAYPISQATFPTLTLIVALLFFNEPFTLFNIVGAAFVILGILMIIKNKKVEISNKFTGKGLALCLIAAGLWAGGALALKIGVSQVDTYLASMIRVVVPALILTGLAFARKSSDRLKLTRYNTRTLILVACAGILTYGIGAIGYVSAIQLIGAGKAVLLTASAPVFILPLSVFILKERPSTSALIGIFISIAGICLVAL